MISSTGKVGGGPSHIFMLMKLLSKHFELFLAMPKNNYSKSNLDFLKLKNFISINERKVSLFDILKLYKYIKKNDIKIIHSHGKGAGLIGRILAILLNRKHIHTYHGIHLRCHSFLNRLFYIFYENIFKNLDSARIFVSESEKNYAIDSGISLSKISIIIPNGVNLKERINKSNKIKIRNNIRKKLNIESNQICVITLARLVQQKNLKEIIEISKYFKFHKFLILGEGILRKELEDLIKTNNIKNVFLLGNKKNVFNYLIASDIYLTSSLYEGLPIAVLEAMSIGLPIIASDVVGNKDTVKHNYSGFLYSLGDIKKACDSLEELSNNNIKRYKFGLNSRKLQIKFFSKNIMKKKYTDLYNLIN